MRHTASIQDATTFVTTAIEGGGAVTDAEAAYDVPGIVSDLWDEYGTYDLDTVEMPAFWDIIANHAR